MRLRSGIAIVLAVLVAVLVWWVEQDGRSDPGTAPTSGIGSESGSGVDARSGLPWVDASALPAEARKVLVAIDEGGPFVRDKDGSTFGNYERVLPPQARGYYREYTVPTPGIDHAGARRIVTGSADEYYWTADHYQTFERIRR